MSQLNPSHLIAHLSFNRYYTVDGCQFVFQVLTPEEKRFLLFVERGDCASVARTIKTYKAKPYLFDINCTDPLGRSALSIAIINENPEMMELLLEEAIQVKDALLLAISEEYVEGVELLLQVCKTIDISYSINGMIS